MDRLYLKTLRDDFEAKAQKAYDQYRTSGCSRHLKDCEVADAVADGLTIALNAVDEHNELLHLRNAIRSWHGEVDSLKYRTGENRERTIEGLLSEIRSTAHLHDL